MIIEGTVKPRAKGRGSLQNITDVYVNKHSIGDIYFLALKLKQLYNRRLPRNLENKLLEKPHLAVDYAWKVLKRRWPELEGALVTSTNLMLLLKYYVRVAKVRMPKNLEDRLAYSFPKMCHAGSWGMQEDPYSPINSNDGLIFIQYAKKNIRGRWLALEKAFCKMDISTRFYQDKLNYPFIYMQQVSHERLISYENTLLSKFGIEWMLGKYIPNLKLFGIPYEAGINPRLDLALTNEVF